MDLVIGREYHVRSTSGKVYKFPYGGYRKGTHWFSSLRVAPEQLGNRVTELTALPKNPAAQALGRLGGKARAKSLTPEQRTEIARKGGLARHGLTKTYR